MLPAVWHDERQRSIELVRYLAALGHTRVARVAGRAVGFVHSTARTAAFEEATQRARALGERRSRPTTRPRAAPARPASCCSDPEPPTAIAYDSDVLAVTGLGVAQQMGFSVPDDVSIVAWDDSLLCQVVHPPLTTMTRDISDVRGARLQAAPCGDRRIDGATEDVETPRGELTPRGEHGPRPASARAHRGRARAHASTR